MFFCIEVTLNPTGSASQKLRAWKNWGKLKKIYEKSEESGWYTHIRFKPWLQMII